LGILGDAKTTMFPWCEIETDDKGRSRASEARGAKTAVTFIGSSSGAASEKLTSRLIVIRACCCAPGETGDGHSWTTVEGSARLLAMIPGYVKNGLVGGVEYEYLKNSFTKVIIPVASSTENAKFPNNKN
jgi:hypothetical protein